MRPVLTRPLLTRFVNCWERSQTNDLPTLMNCWIRLRAKKSKAPSSNANHAKNDTASSQPCSEKAFAVNNAELRSRSPCRFRSAHVVATVARRWWLALTGHTNEDYTNRGPRNRRPRSGERSYIHSLACTSCSGKSHSNGEQQTLCRIEFVAAHRQLGCGLLERSRWVFRPIDHLRRR